MSDINELFKNSTEKVKKLSYKPDDRILLELYGLYKQSIVGNINIEKPWVIQMEACAKWEAWNSCKGMDKEISMLKYVNIVNMLIN